MQRPGCAGACGDGAGRGSTRQTIARMRRPGRKDAPFGGIRTQRQALRRGASAAEIQRADRLSRRTRSSAMDHPWPTTTPEGGITARDGPPRPWGYPSPVVATHNLRAGSNLTIASAMPKNSRWKIRITETIICAQRFVCRQATDSCAMQQWRADLRLTRLGAGPDRVQQHRGPHPAPRRGTLSARICHHRRAASSLAPASKSAATAAIRRLSFIALRRSQL